MYNGGYEILLRGSHVICYGSGSDGARDVAVRVGHIAAVTNAISSPSATEVVDITGKLVLPTVVDSHVHVYHISPASSGSHPTL